MKACSNATVEVCIAASMQAGVPSRGGPRDGVVVVVQACIPSWCSFVSV